MTNENLFKEVEDDLERQRYEELWKRYGSLVIAGALAIIIGTGGYNFWQTRTMESQQKATGQLVELLNVKGDPAKQIDALEAFATANKGQTQAVFATLHAAAEAAKAGKNEVAVKIYDAVAADASADHAFRQLADLLAVQIQMDTGDAAQLQTRLQPLMADKEPWRYTAKEYAGFLAMRAGDKAKAKSMFTDLAQDASAPQSLSSRAADMLKVLAD